MKFLYMLFLLPMNVMATTIAIDIGHSTKDPGAISAYGNTEYSYNKVMANAITDKLRNNGNKVRVINPSGNRIELQQRTKLASGADLFVSIHHDSVQQYDLKYWDYKGERQHYNDKEKGFGIFVSTQNPHFEKSLSCAQLVSTNLIQAGFTPNYYHNKHPRSNPRELFSENAPIYRYDNLAVLRTASMPAILIEVGVIVNRNEALWIAQADVRQAFSQAVANALSKCV